MKPRGTVSSVWRRVLFVAVGFASVATNAQDPLFRFTGKDPNEPTNWQKPLNWELNGEPASRVPGTGPDDRVIVPGNEVSNPNAIVKSLSFGGSITGGSISVRESLEMLGGTFRACNVTILDNATLTSTVSGLNGFDSCIVENRGIFAPKAVGLGALPGESPTLLINDPLTGRIHLQDGSVIGSNQGGKIQSGGVFLKLPGPGVATVAGVQFLQSISGFLECQGGTLRLGLPNPSAGSFICDRPIVVSTADAVIEIAGASSELKRGARITGPGKALIRHVMVSGAIQVENMEIPSNSSLEGDGELTLVGLLVVNGGSILGGSDTSGTPGLVTVESTGTLRFAPNQNGATLARNVRNFGRVLQEMGTGPGLPLGNVTLFAVENMPEGLIELSSTGGFGPRSLKNQGVLRKSANTLLNTDQSLSVGCENTGLIEIQTGLLRFQGLTQTAGELRVSAGAEARFQGPGAVFSGGVVSGAGTFRGVSGSSPVHFANLIRPSLGSATLTIIKSEESIVLDASARYEFNIGGLVPGTEYPQMDLNQPGGKFPLAGTVAVNFVNGFSPSLGQSFSLIRYAEGRAGVFSGFTGLNSVPGLLLVPRYLPKSLDLVAVEEPALAVSSVAPTSVVGRFRSVTGLSYQFETSEDLTTWISIGNSIVGNGITQEILLEFEEGHARFFRLRLFE